jgi:glutamate racemase
MKQKDTKKCTIGMFDSGVGGLTVLSEVKRLLPDDIFIYFGDTARCPYGGKSSSTILRYSIENSNFLHAKGIDLLVVACHTATAHALDTLKTLYKIPVVGVVEPAIEKAVQVTLNNKIGVIGTRATIDSQVYQKAISARLKQAEVFALACPLFVPLIEEQFPHRIITRSVVREYLNPLKEQGIDTLLLGCTHYPLLLDLIQECMGDEVKIVNPAEACAQSVFKLKEKLSTSNNCDEKKAHQFFVSDDPDRFRTIGEKFFGHPLLQINTYTHT